MKGPNERLPTEHPRDLLFHYLEGELDPEERGAIKQHLNTCAACLKEFRMLDETVNMLRANKEAFCPEAWEVYEFVKTGVDSDGSLTRHVSSCPTCSEEAEVYQAKVPVTALPEIMREAISERFTGKVPHFRKPDQTPMGSGWFSSSVVRRRIMACGTLAAVIALVVLMYPRGTMESMIGFSSTIWEQTENYLTPKAGPLVPPKTNAAVLFILREFPKAFPQAEIDSLYRSVKPGPELSERFQFIQPTQIRDALGDSKIGPEDREALLGALRDKLSVQRLLLLTVSPTGTAFHIEGELIDLTNGQVLKKQSGQVPGKSKLISSIGEWLSLLE